MGVTLEKRGTDDPHVMVGVEVEDDENWFRKLTVSSYWLDELIEVLQLAKMKCQTLEPDVAKDGRTYGWKFGEK